MESAPDDIEDVLASARQLAEALAASDRAIALREARRAIESDPEAERLFQEFDAVGRRIQGAAQSGLEPDMEDRIALNQAKNEAAGHPALWELLRRQADYVELLVAIDRTIFENAPRMGRGLV